MTDDRTPLTDEVPEPPYILTDDAGRIWQAGYRAALRASRAEVERLRAEVVGYRTVAHRGRM